MSQENVELVRNATDAWNSDGVEAMLAFYPEDVVWYPFPESPESATGFHGHDGIRDVMRGWNDSFDEYALAPGEIRDYGDKVVGLGELSGGGKIGKARFFPFWEAALSAVGLSE